MDVDSLIDHPGISLAELVDQMSVTSLRSFLTDDVIGLLERLDSESGLTDRLRFTVAHELDNAPGHSIRDTSFREKLILALPLAKARELADLLGLPHTKYMYRDLVSECVTKGEPALSTLSSFFGIVEKLEVAQDQTFSSGQIVPNYSLFDFQRNIVQRVRTLISEYPYASLVHMPTGSGKTRTAMHILSNHLNENDDALVIWLATTSELLDQASETFSEGWQSIGIRPINSHKFWGRHNTDLTDVESGIVFAGLQKMHSWSNRDINGFLKFADRTTLVVVDEAHQAVARTYRAVIETLFNKRPRTRLLGLTATPGRSWDDVAEDSKLAEFFNSRKVTIETPDGEDAVSYLISSGYLARAKFHQIESDWGVNFSESETKSSGSSGDFSDETMERLSQSSDRNFAIIQNVSDMLKRHDRIILFAASVRHATLISSALALLGITSFTVTANTIDTERSRIIRRFRSSDSQPMVLCNYGVLTTGFDAPRTSAVVIARPTNSLVLYSQMVGRAIRGPKAGGNESAEILTVVDTNIPGFGDVSEAFLNWEDVWID